MACVPGMTRRRPESQYYVGLPKIDDDLPSEVKSQMALRAATWVEGRCPHCGAERELTAYVELNLVQVVFQHAIDCPVASLLDQEREP